MRKSRVVLGSPGDYVGDAIAALHTGERIVELGVMEQGPYTGMELWNEYAAAHGGEQFVPTSGSRQKSLRALDQLGFGLVAQVTDHVPKAIELTIRGKFGGKAVGGILAEHVLLGVRPGLPNLLPTKTSGGAMQARLAILDTLVSAQSPPTITALAGSAGITPLRALKHTDSLVAKGIAVKESLPQPPDKVTYRVISKIGTVTPRRRVAKATKAIMESLRPHLKPGDEFTLSEATSRVADAPGSVAHWDPEVQRKLARNILNDLARMGVLLRSDIPLTAVALTADSLGPVTELIKKLRSVQSDSAEILRWRERLMGYVSDPETVRRITAR